MYLMTDNDLVNIIIARYTINYKISQITDYNIVTIQTVLARQAPCCPLHRTLFGALCSAEQ